MHSEPLVLITQTPGDIGSPSAVTGSKAFQSPVALDNALKTISASSSFTALLIKREYTQPCQSAGGGDSSGTGELFGKGTAD